jgi:hypothetical protein
LKISYEEFNEEMLKKLEVSTFETWFPGWQTLDPKEYFKTMINTEVEWVHNSILDMVKLWDSKLVKLRNDMNIQSITRRISEKADSVEVNEALQL